VQLRSAARGGRGARAARDFVFDALGEGFNTQVITLWCFYIVGREILTLGEGFNTPGTLLR
jgi:hypothetical protein